MLCRGLLAHNQINPILYKIVRKEGFFSKVRIPELDGCHIVRSLGLTEQPVPDWLQIPAQPESGAGP